MNTRPKLDKTELKAYRGLKNQLAEIHEHEVQDVARLATLGREERVQDFHAGDWILLDQMPSIAKNQGKKSTHTF